VTLKVIDNQYGWLS